MLQTVRGRGIVCLQVPSVLQTFTVQSSPPDAISPVTRVVMAKTKPVCPLNVWIRFPSVVQSFTVSSFEQLANPRPGTSVSPLMMSSWAAGISFYKLFWNQSLMLLSWDPVMIMPLGRLRTETACWWPSRTALHWPVLVSQTLAVPSQEPLTNSSGIDYERLLTLDSCPMNSFAGFPSPSTCIIFLSWDAE